MGVDGGVPCRSGRPQNAWAASSRRHKGRSEQPGLGAPAPRWQQRVLRSLSPFPRLPRCVPLAAETPTTSRGCRLQLRARNGVEEPAQDFHVRGHVLVVDGGSKNFVCQIIGDLLEEALACGLFMFQVMVHAQTHVQHQVQTQDAVVNPRKGTSQDAAPSVTASTRSHPPCRMKGKSIILTNGWRKWLQHRTCSHRTVVGQHDTSL